MAQIDGRWGEAEPSSNAIASENADWMQTPIVGEDESMRGRFHKQFLAQDGLRYLAVYPEAVHYWEDDAWKEIDNTLRAAETTNGPVLRNAAGVWDVSLPQTMNERACVRLAKDGYTLSFSLEGKYDRQIGEITPVRPSESTEAAVSETEGIVSETLPREEENEAPMKPEAEPGTEAETETERELSIETMEPPTSEPPQPSPEAAIEAHEEDAEPTPEAPPEETAQTDGGASAEIDKINVGDLTYVRTAMAAQSAAILTPQQAHDSASPLENAAQIDKINVAVAYEDIYRNVTLRYDLRAEELKESIVIERESDADSLYRFHLRADGLTFVLNEDGSIYACARDGEPIFVLPAPYLIDDAGEVSFDVSVTLEEADGAWLLTYAPDADWLHDESRAYPVTIDPVIRVNLSTNNIADHTVCSASQGFTYTSQSIEAGRQSHARDRAHLYDVQQSSRRCRREASSSAHPSGCIDRTIPICCR